MGDRGRKMTQRRLALAVNHGDLVLETSARGGPARVGCEFDERRTPAHSSAPATSPSFASVVVGWLVGGSTSRALLVDFDGNASGPLAARTAVRLDARTVEDAVRQRQGVLLQFERGCPELPVVTGLVQVAEPTLASPLARADGDSREESDEETPPAGERVEPPTHRDHIEAKLDGKSVVLEAENDILLRCGRASITLTRDGKVILRGAYIETHSGGVNRIKGAAVRIN